MEDVVEKILKARKDKPCDITFNKKFIKDLSSKDEIEFWNHELDLLRTDKYSKHYPRKDFFSLKEYSSIAIVGNSGCLDGAGNGSEIDDHDCIVRFNTAPVEGYEKDVGSRTDFRFSIGTLNYRSSDEKLIRSYRKNRQAVKDFHKIFKKDWHLILTHHFCKWVQSFKNEDSGNTVCSTGFIGVFFGLLVSDKVSLYGFSLPENENFDYHYYNDSPYVERSHNFKEEHGIYKLFDEKIDEFRWIRN